MIEKKRMLVHKVPKKSVLTKNPQPDRKIPKKTATIANSILF